MRIVRFRAAVPAALIAALVLVAGCDSDGTGGEAPAVVAPGAFEFDATFPQTAHSGGDMENWANGASRVGVVTLAVGVHLVMPALATHAATQADPVVVDGTWIWENTIPIEGTPVTFRLEGTPEGQETDWRMLISSDEAIDGAAYDGFELYNATTTLDGRAGHWRLYYLIEDVRTHVLSADFDVDSDDVREITFTVPETNPNPDARGSTVLYDHNGDARQFDWHQEPEDFDHLVEWSESTHAGSITATNYNGGVRACWDTALQNVEC
jgi:hypothetical protein